MLAEKVTVLSPSSQASHHQLGSLGQIGHPHDAGELTDYFFRGPSWPTSSTFGEEPTFASIEHG